MPKQYYWLLKHIPSGKIIRAGRTASDIAEFVGVSPHLVGMCCAHQTLRHGCRIDKIDPDLANLSKKDAAIILVTYESPCVRCGQTEATCNRPCPSFRFWVRLKLQAARTAFGVRTG